MKRRSAIFSRAVAAYHQCRADYGLYLESAYAAAEEATAGRLLNRRGVAAGIDPFSLFKGNRARAYAYASEELVEWWRSRPRVTFEAFERDWPYEEFIAPVIDPDEPF